MRSVTVRLDDLRTMILNLGYVGENEHRTFNFDCKKMFGEYPSASVSLTVQPPAGDCYPATVERNGDLVSWTVSDSDLIEEGCGEIQLTFMVGEVVAKTCIGRTKVERSLGATGDIPTPIENWIEQAEEVISEAEAATAAAEGAAEHQPIIDDNGYWAVWDADAEEYVATEYKAQGTDGHDGVGIVSIEKTGTSGLVDTYTITFTSGNPVTYTVTNGRDADPTEIIDDNAGSGDTDKVWSADKSHELLTQINSKADEPTGTKSAGKVYGLDSNLNPAWVDGGGGSVDPAVIAQAVDDWLDDHPEAVTTVQDGAVTFAKLNDALQAYLTTYDYYTGWSDPDITVSTGYLKTDGTLADSANYRTTGYIPVSEGDKFDYKLYSTSTACMVFGYNASKVAVSGSGVVGSSTFVTGVYTVPSGVSFIRISTYNPNIGSSYWSSQAKIKKTVYDSDVIQDLFDGIAGESAKLTTASASGTDVGKVPAVKTVTNNKVSEWELKEIPLFNVPGTETTVDIKATGSTGTAQSIWGLTPVKASNYYVKNVSLKVKANVAVTIYLAEKLSNSSIKVIKKVGEIETHAEDGYYSFTPGKPVRVKIGEFLLATFSAKSVFYQNGSGLVDQYLYDTSRQTVEENTTYANDSLYWGSFALCSEIVYASETSGNLTEEVYEVVESVEQIKDEIGDISEVADSLEKHPYVSVFFDNFNSSNSDWLDSDEAWTFDYTNQNVVSTANGDVYAKTNCLILNRKYLADKRLMSFRCKFASDTVLDIGFNNADTTHDGCNKVTIDIGNHQIKMYDMYKNATSSYPLLDTKDISGFTIDTDKWYMVRVERHNLVATVSIQDYITGESVSMNYTFLNGFFFEELYTIAKVSGGNITIKDFDVSIMNEPLIYVVGDSITAYACEVGGWVERFNKDLNNRIVASGRGNDNATSVATLFDTEVKYIKPKVLMWCHGHNGGGVTSQGLAAIKTLCDGIGCKMYVNHITCMASDNHIARNAIIDADGYRGAKFDVATARNGMPYVVPGDSAIRADSSLYMDGNIHPNLAGNLKMYERLRIDVPELFMQ